MKKIKAAITYFSKTELLLWGFSLGIIFTCFLLSGNKDYFSLCACLTGVTSLIFSAKGNPAGQLLMVIFSLFYGRISYGFSYYGEMITYLGMTAPMAFFAFISWVRNPYKGKRSVVKINRLSKKELPLFAFLTLAVTTAFYFILEYFSTANLFFSTLSVTTSFIAVYLTFRRSSFFALAYAANDVILLVLWITASFYDKSYISVAACFVVFLINDLYGFYNWTKMKKMQQCEHIN